jgi:spore maturation protein B
MVAVGVLRASGFLDFIAGLLSGVCGKLGIPASIVPLIIVRLLKLLSIGIPLFFIVH